MSAHRYGTAGIYRRLIAEARPYWPHLTAILLLSLLSTPLVLLTPLPLKIAVDSIIGSQPVSGLLARVLPAAVGGNALLFFSAALVVAIAFLNHLQTSASAVLRTYTGEKLVLAFRAKLFRHAQRLSLAYHDTRGTTDSTYRIQYDAPAIEWILIDGVSPFITAAFTLCGMLYVAGRIDGELALVALAIAPVLWLIAWAYRDRLRKRWNEVYQLQSSAISVVQEVLAAVRVVRAFGQEEREHDRFVRRSSQSVWARIRIAFAEGGFGLLVGLTIAAGTAAVLFIGTRHVQSGVLTLGGLLMVMTYIAQLYGPLQTLSSMAAHMQASLASAERAFSLLDQAPDVAERPDAVALARSAGAVAFAHVSFAYDSRHAVLDDVSFEVAPTSRVGVTGVTGAGKSTLVSLLTRFYDPTAGRILLDGVDLRDYKLADLRNQFAIVLQETVLFSTSIAENIAYANPGAGFDEIVAAAKAANAHDFIARLPDGYDTAVGERGMRLSGGERQRIALARAFLKNAPILILDEPTSAVDVKTESLIMEAMDRLMRGRTTFIITHRPSMLRNCDVRVEVENGRLIEIAPVAVTA
ncbi:MAG TPA: ABC transporter ATP-binding protein [Candidatus Binatia bacterium]|jgi:ATP-binding cassette subfamily B protein